MQDKIITPIVGNYYALRADWQWAATVDMLRAAVPECRHFCDRHGIEYHEYQDGRGMYFFAYRGHKFGIFDEFYARLKAYVGSGLVYYQEITLT